MNHEYSNQARTLRTLRTMAGMSQSELSIGSGLIKDVGRWTKVNGQFISNVERGLCGIPSKHIRCIAEAIAKKDGIISWEMAANQLIAAKLDDKRQEIGSIVGLANDAG